MTRQEQTGKRNLDFSGWIRVNLPDSYEGFRVSDLDFILANVKTKKIMLLEKKMYGGECSRWQCILFADMDRWIKKGIDKEWTYLGFHMVVFGNTSPNNGQIRFDGELISEEELIEKLSF